MTRKVVLITGASQGIGKDIALRLSKRNFQLVLVARNEKKLKSLRNYINKKFENCEYHVCDVTELSQIEELFNELRKEKMLPSIIINNAGFGGPFENLEDTTEAVWDKVFNTNVKSLYYILKNAVPYLKKNNFGKIINIASAYGVIGGEKSVAYSSSKHAVIGFTRSLALELSDYNIQCNAILPGFINTEMAKQNQHMKLAENTPSKKMGQPSDISDLVLHLVETKSKYLHGSSLIVDGGLTAGLRFNEI
jgi:3-oxoacyl-[acyl-carrier protein] reductase